MRAIALLLVPALADAAPCADAIVDPIATPLRESDHQRGACLRDELSVALTSHALVDEPNFHGVIGGDLALGGRLVVRERLELGARLRLVDYTFVQTAVNKVTATRYGPLAIGAAYALDDQLSAIAIAELPFTRDEMDTLHTSGQLGLAFTTALARTLALHARLGLGFAYASSAGGDQHRIAPRAGTDLVWHPHAEARTARFGFQLGADAEAGWRGGFGTLLVRAGVAIRAGRAYRIELAAGAPLLGDEPTTLITTIGVGRDL